MPSCKDIQDQNIKDQWFYFSSCKYRYFRCRPSIKLTWICAQFWVEMVSSKSLTKNALCRIEKLWNLINLTAISGRFRSSVWTLTFYWSRWKQSFFLATPWHGLSYPMPLFWSRLEFSHELYRFDLKLCSKMERANGFMEQLLIGRHWANACRDTPAIHLESQKK